MDRIAGVPAPNYLPAVLCPHCRGRPRAGHHGCPLNLEADGCECCGPCAKTCADIARHIETHTTHVFIDRGYAEVEISYLESSLTGEEDPGDFGLTA